MARREAPLEAGPSRFHPVPTRPVFASREGEVAPFPIPVGDVKWEGPPAGESVASQEGLPPLPIIVPEPETDPLPPAKTDSPEQEEAGQPSDDDLPRAGDSSTMRSSWVFGPSPPEEGGTADTLNPRERAVRERLARRRGY